MADHQFDRRTEDANYAALSTRMKSLEGHVHDAMTPELAANTRLTKQVHEALMGTGEDDERSVQFKVKEMHEAFAAARGGLKTLEAIGRVAKPLAVIATFCGAVVALWHTGHWTWPK